MDKFILSRMNSMVKDVDTELSNYCIPEAAKALCSFVDELSSWHVRRSRERFWVSEMPDDKVAAYMTLYTSLVTLAKAAAPMVPVHLEDIYQNLVRTVDKNAPRGVHLCDFPTVCESMIDKKLEDDMNSSSTSSCSAEARATVQTSKTVSRFPRSMSRPTAT